MTRTDYRLVLALALSLILHLAPLLSAIITPAPTPAKATPLNAQLRPAPAPPPTQAPLIMPEQAPPRPAASQSKTAKPQIVQAGAPRVRNWQEAVKRQLQKLDERGQFYPAEAISQGLEGEALVLMIIDPNGQVSAARLEQSSGHRLLDDAALRAVRSLRSLPSDAPHESLLPVRFRLK